MSAPGVELFEVRMLGMPLVLRERSRQQGADLLREMTLIRTGLTDGSTTGQVPGRLLELAAELDTFYTPYLASSSQEMDAALDRGEDTLDEVVYHLPVRAVVFVQHIAEILEEVEEFCRGDDYLLILAPPPDITLYRSWSIAEVVRQHAGEQPTPWSVYAAEHGID